MTCGGVTRFPEQPQVEQLTGIFVSTYTSVVEKLLTLCDSTITNLPENSSSRYVRFNVISSTEENPNGRWTFGDRSFSDLPSTLVVNFTSSVLLMRYESEKDPFTGEFDPMYFMIKFTGKVL